MSDEMMTNERSNDVLCEIIEENNLCKNIDCFECVLFRSTEDNSNLIENALKTPRIDYE
jgi:hypothetical protein